MPKFIKQHKPSKIFGLLRSYSWDILFHCVLIVLTLLVIHANFESGTWYIGWDSLMNELNLRENFFRSIAGVWQEFQGLGVLGGHGYVSQLIHVLVLSFFDLFFPKNLLRYLYTFNCWIVGGIGSYWLIKYLVHNKVKSIESSAAGFLTSIIYLFHFITVQNFYVQLDSFIWFYAWLPWALILLFWTVSNPTTKKYLLFLVFQLWFSFIGFIPPVFVGYIFLVAIVLTVSFLQHRSRNALKTGFIIAILIGVANSYWLGPLSYFTLTQKDVYLDSKLNQITTSQNVEKSEEYGKIENVIQGKGFYLDSLDFDFATNTATPILSPWIDFIETASYRITAQVLFAFALIGSIYCIYLEKNKQTVSLFLLGLTSFSSLVISTEPFSYFSQIIRLVPILNQAFRIPFTKFSIAYILFLSIFVGYFFLLLFRILKKKLTSTALSLAVVLVVTVVSTGFLNYGSVPVFKGHFLYEKLRLDVPESYFELINYFKTKPSKGRVAMFPVHTFNGWYVNDWGYTGSGFIFYGLSQPVLDRAFDVWSPYNETFYKEISHAVYSENKDLIRSVLEKYVVESIIFDTSVVDSSSTERSLSYIETISLLQSSGFEKKWEKESLIVLERSDPIEEDIIEVTSSQTSYLFKDPIYNAFDSYVIDSNNPTFKFPFVSLQQEKLETSKVKKGFSGKTSLSLSPEDITISDGDELVLPSFKMGTKFSVSATAEYKDNILTIDTATPIKVIIDDDSFEYPLPKFEVPIDENLSSLYVSFANVNFKISDNTTEILNSVDLTIGEPIKINIYDIENAKPYDLTQDFYSTKAQQCWTRTDEGFIRDRLSLPGRTFIVEDASSCLPMRIGNFEQDGIIEVSLTHQSSDGARPNFCVVPEGQEVYDCLNEEVFYETFTSLEGSTVRREILVNSGSTYWIDITTRPPDNINQTWSINYGIPGINFYPVLRSFTFPPNLWASFYENYRVPLNKDSHIEMHMYTLEESVEIENSIEAITNCDLKTRGKIERSFTNNNLVYSSSDFGASCDFFILDDASVDTSRVLRIKGKNISGSVPKLYVTNLSNDRNVFEHVIFNDADDVLIPLNSSSGENIYGYKVIFENRSFSSQSTINSLELIESYAVPTNWVSNIMVESSKKDFDGVSKIPPSKINSYGTGFKHITLEESSINSDLGLLTFDTSYNEGWKLIGSRGHHYKKQLLYNGWATSWLINPNESFYILLFIPQIISWVGFLGLILTIVLISVYLLAKKYDRKRTEE